MNEDKKMVKRIKLIDFGFGVFKDKLKDLSDREKYAGTPGFIAPEIYQMKEYDEKIDTFSLGIILYFMLYGYLPFQSNYIEEIQEMTLGCNISLRNNHWSNVSEEAKDLILKILTSADKRITTKQALDHPWLQDVDRLKEFQGRNKKQRILF